MSERSPKQFSRRDFFTLAGKGLAGSMVTGCAPEQKPEEYQNNNPDNINFGGLLCLAVPTAPLVIYALSRSSGRDDNEHNE